MEVWRGVVPRSLEVAGMEPKPYNPFEEEETPPLHPAWPPALLRPTWTPCPSPCIPGMASPLTSSPKTKHHSAHEVPSASPLALQTSQLSHSEPPSATPSPALSVESLSS